MQLNAEMQFAHLNLRRERSGEEAGPVAADIKLTASLSIDALREVFATAAGFAQLASLWQDNGELATGEWDSLSLRREGSGLEVTLAPVISKQPIQFTGAELNKIRLTPKPGRCCDVSVRLQVKPSEEQIGQLGELLLSTVSVSAVQPQRELDMPQLPDKTPMQRANEELQKALDLSAVRASVADGDPAVLLDQIAAADGEAAEDAADAAVATQRLSEICADGEHDMQAREGDAADVCSKCGVVAVEVNGPAVSHPCAEGHEWSDDDGVNPVICVRCDVTYMPPQDDAGDGGRDLSGME